VLENNLVFRKFGLAFEQYPCGIGPLNRLAAFIKPEEISHMGWTPGLQVLHNLLGGSWTDLENPFM